MVGSKVYRCPVCGIQMAGAPSRCFGRVSFLGGRDVTSRGFYIVSDQYFIDFPDPYLKGNKTQNRPHYYAFKDERTGLFWMVPMSSRIEKYRRIINGRINQGKPCDILHIARLDNGQEAVFIISDIFPVTEKYIVREYFIGVNHLRVTSEHLANCIDQKCRRILGMIRRGVKLSQTQPDVLKIERMLLKN